MNTIVEPTVDQEKEKLEIIKWVTTLKDNAVIEMLSMLREKPGKINWWNGISEGEKRVMEQ